MKRFTLLMAAIICLATSALAQVSENQTLSTTLWKQGIARCAHYTAYAKGFAKRSDEMVARFPQGYTLDDLNDVYENQGQKWEKIYNEFKKEENNAGSIAEGWRRHLLFCHQLGEVRPLVSLAGRARSGGCAGSRDLLHLQRHGVCQQRITVRRRVHPVRDADGDFCRSALHRGILLDALVEQQLPPHAAAAVTQQTQSATSR